jgi:hypothetical protein
MQVSIPGSPGGRSGLATAASTPRTDNPRDDDSYSSIRMDEIADGDHRRIKVL